MVFTCRIKNKNHRYKKKQFNISYSILVSEQSTRISVKEFSLCLHCLSMIDPSCIIPPLYTCVLIYWRLNSHLEVIQSCYFALNVLRFEIVIELNITDAINVGQVEASAEFPDGLVTTGTIIVLDDIPVFYIYTGAPSLVSHTNISHATPIVNLSGTDVAVWVTDRTDDITL